MFSKLLKLHKKTKNIHNETFSIYEVEKDGKVFILRFKNNMLHRGENKKYPFQVGITLQINTENGFPTKQENERLLDLEEFLEEEFAYEHTAIFVGAIMGSSMKEFIFYTGKQNETAAIFEKLRDKFHQYQLQCIIQEDPHWEIYKTFTQNLYREKIIQ